MLYVLSYILSLLLFCPYQCSSTDEFLQELYRSYGRSSSDTWLSVLDDSYSQGRYAGWTLLSFCCVSAPEDLESPELSRWEEDGVVVPLSHGVKGGQVMMAFAPPVTKRAVELLQASNFTVEIVTNDMEGYILTSFSKSRASKSILRNYFELHEIEGYLKQLALRYPDAVKIRTIGETYKKRPIIQVIVNGNNNDSNSTQKNDSPVIFIDAGTHAREWLSVAAALFIITELARTHSSLSAEWRIVPVVNPDGYHYSWNKDRLWRKNRKPTSRRVCVGTDINRNFPIDFDGYGSSRNPCREDYRGISPASEPETQTMIKAVNEVKGRMKLYISLHSYSQLILLPWAYTFRKHPRYNDMKNFAEGMRDAIKTQRNTIFNVFEAWDGLYLASGTSVDWVADQAVPYTILMELHDEGEHGFIWPEEEIESAVKEIWKGIDYAGQRIEKEFSKPQRPDSAVPATTTTTAAETTDTRTESMPVLKENTPDEISFTTDSDEPLTEVPGPTEPFSESSSDRPDWQVNSEILRKILDQLELYPEDPFE